MTSSEPVGNPNTWRAAVRSLATDYYDLGHHIERGATKETDHTRSSELWAQAECYQQIYNELCALIDRVDPRPGGAGGTARPW